MNIDLNSDLGGGYGAWTMGDDQALLDIVSSANIACGQSTPATPPPCAAPWTGRRTRRRHRRARLLPRPTRLRPQA